MWLPDESGEHPVPLSRWDKCSFHFVVSVLISNLENNEYNPLHFKCWKKVFLSMCSKLQKSSEFSVNDEITLPFCFQGDTDHISEYNIHV